MNDTTLLSVDEIKTIMYEKMVETIHILESKTGKSFKIPTLIIKQLGRVAGRAKLKHGQFGVPLRDAECEIYINPDFCYNGNCEDMLNNTLPHEVAHCIAPVLYNPWKHGNDTKNGWGHGRAWKDTMRLLGLEPTRCHQYNTDGVTTRNKSKLTREFVYKCGCREHNLTKIMHNRFQLGQYTRLHCKSCKVSLKYIGISGIDC